MSTSIERVRKYVGLTGICIASFLGCIDLTVVNTILPAIGREFASPIQTSQWVASVFMAALAAFMVPAGNLADRFGRKRLLMGGLAMFGVASLLAGTATQVWALIAYRFVQGMACAVLYTVSGAIISYTFEESEQGKALGILFGVNGVGLALGPIIGGLFAGTVDWRWAFLINLPFIGVSLGLCGRHIPEAKAARKPRLDVPGCVLLLLALLALLTELSVELPTFHRWLLPLALLAFAGFVRHELSTTEPIVEFHFFRDATFRAALLATFFLAFAYCSVLLTFPMLLSREFGKGEVAIGMFLLPATTSFAAMSAWIGSRSQRFGPSRVVVIGLGAFACSFALFAAGASSHDARWFLGPLLLFGIGWGAILGPSTLVALSAFPRDKAAVAMGTSWTVHNVGGACGIAFSIFLMGRFDGFLFGYQALMGMLALIMVAVCGAHQVLRRTASAGFTG